MRAMLIVLSFLASVMASAQDLKPMGDEAFNLLRQFYEYDRTMPLDVWIVEKAEFDNCIREKIVFTGVQNDRVPGYLAIPKTGKKPCPVVFLLHGLSGSKIDWWVDTWKINQNMVTNGLLDAGYAILSLDAQFHGERMFANGYESPGIFALEREQYNRLRNLVIQSSVEYLRVLDFLGSRGDIDTTRVGIAGYSMGGMMTHALFALDRRFDVAVSCVGGNFRHNPMHPASTVPLQNPVYLISPIHFSPRIVDRPILLLMARQDNFFDAPQSQQVFDLIRSPEKKIIWYDSGHLLPKGWETEVVNWFKKYL
jgi:dienelactone hydrolase